MSKLIRVLKKESVLSSNLVKELSEVIEQNKNTENFLIAGQKARTKLKCYIERNHKEVFDKDLKDLFEIEPSLLVSSNYLAIYKNKRKGSKTIAMSFIDNFIKDYPECIKTTKELAEFY